jgi:hypothetical protein
VKIFDFDKKLLEENAKSKLIDEFTSYLDKKNNKTIEKGNCWMHIRNSVWAKSVYELKTASTDLSEISQMKQWIQDLLVLGKLKENTEKTLLELVLILSKC